MVNNIECDFKNVIKSYISHEQFEVEIILIGGIYIIGDNPVYYVLKNRNGKDGIFVKNKSITNFKTYIIINPSDLRKEAKVVLGELIAIKLLN